MAAAVKIKSKVCFVIPSLNRGGAEKVLINLANHFNRSNCEPIIIALNKSVPAYNIDKGIKIFYLTDRKSDNMFFRLYYMSQLFLKLLLIIRKEKPVWVVSFITSANLWAGAICTIANIPYIVSERTSPDRSIAKLNLIGRELAAVIYKRAISIVVGARGVETHLRKNRAFNKLNNIRVIPNAVPSFEMLSFKKVHNRRFILGIGRLAYVKGFDQLISAFGAAKLNNIDLLIIGEGEERTALLSQIENLGLTGKVFMPGSRADLQDYYNQAELFVLPSRNEGYPNALIEAMSFGCPCIALNCDFGPGEIIENEYNGLLVENGNISALTESITRLNDDFELKSKISENAKRINQTNSPQSIFKKWEQLVSVSNFTDTSVNLNQFKQA
jgi:glycosyltransferase involved in cell wall biosynthesis